MIILWGEKEFKEIRRDPFWPGLQIKEVRHTQMTDRTHSDDVILNPAKLHKGETGDRASQL